MYMVGVAILVICQEMVPDTEAGNTMSVKLSKAIRSDIQVDLLRMVVTDPTLPNVVVHSDRLDIDKAATKAQVLALIHLLNHAGLLQF